MGKRSGKKSAHHAKRRIPWAFDETEVTRRVVEQSRECLEAYAAYPVLVQEHANIERATSQGGYGRRQIYELVQNGADALLEDEHCPPEEAVIHLVLTEDALYCANGGAPIDEDGVTAILASHVSMKRGTEIGRFGLGFKSVLGVTRAPEFFSRTGSFKFNSRRAEERIREVVPDATRFPTLRLAEVVDPLKAAPQDPVLAELMEWATTVVRLWRNAEESAWLSEDLSLFPSEFLLFSSHVRKLLLEDRTRTGATRAIHVSHAGKAVLLNEGNSHSKWRVFHTVCTPSPEARKDAGELADRDELPISWAAPLEGRSERGRFWAFFPTEYQTTLSGIVNAPWKTNEDRQNLLNGPFNFALLDAVAELVCDQMWKLSEELEVGKYLDLMPARGREIMNWADERLGDRVYESAVDFASLPDQAGRLRLPEELRVHPPRAPKLALEEWAAYPGRPLDWCHPSVETVTRRSRVDRLIPEDHVASYPEWLEALVTDGSAVASVAALRVFARLLDDEAVPQSSYREAKILQTDDGRMVAPTAGSVFLASEHHEARTDVAYVHRAIAADPGALPILERLGIGPVDPEAELRSYLDAYSRIGTVSVDWDVFWSMARLLQADEANAILTAYPEFRRSIRVRTLSGKFRPIHAVLTEGLIVSTDTVGNEEVTVDAEYHAAEMRLLGMLGVVSAPEPARGSTREAWFDDYLKMCRKNYLEAIPDDSPHPMPEYLEFAEDSFPGPLSPLQSLNEVGRALLTESLLGCETQLAAQWHMRHRTSPAYAKRAFISPALWMIKVRGVLTTSLGRRPVRAAFSPALKRWAAYLPVAECSESAAELLRLRDDIAKLTPEEWTDALQRTERLEGDDGLGAFYALACRAVDAPERLACRIGHGTELRPPEEIVVVHWESELLQLTRDATPVIFVDNEDEAEALVDCWCLKPHEAAIVAQLAAVPTGEPTPLTDEFPYLGFCVETDVELPQLVRCEDIQLEMITDAGKTLHPRDFWRDDGCVYWRDSLGDQRLLETLSTTFGLELREDQIEAILKGDPGEKLRARMVEIRALPDVLSRFAALLPARDVRRHLPEGLLGSIDSDSEDFDATQVARLAQAAYGVDLLREFRAELNEHGYAAPSHWAGGYPAQQFVEALGFPLEYAGFERVRRDALLRVDGPSELPPLHDFQQEIAERTRELVSGGRGRAILSLPTGAGKTRVAVQALVESIKSGELKQPVLWVAQSDELCEQAVQTWQYVWRCLGPDRQLLISRLWSNNEAKTYEGYSHVVVGTLAKLSLCIEKPDYEWLRQAGVIVVDEAHGAIASSYTKFLDWCGLGRAHRRDEAVLLGLTATPFRGVSEEETERLVKRFDNSRLDDGILGEDPYKRLQAMGIIAHVEHEVLEGAKVELDENEQRQVERFRELPKSVGQRLGLDRDRNRTLVESIRRRAEDTTVLVFAGSVAHAQVLAAMLQYEDVPAAAVSGETDATVRRYYVKQFREGTLRVLTNFAVLTEGFDAPAVGAVYVARPTFSPNLYQQMIGRGLRGPKNGGKESCIIANVRDNLDMYGERLAFNHFDYLWRRG